MVKSTMMFFFHLVNWCMSEFVEFSPSGLEPWLFFGAKPSTKTRTSQVLLVFLEFSYVHFMGVNKCRIWNYILVILSNQI